MRRILLFFVVVTVTYECNGHLPKLGDILAGAHQHIHSQVQDIASTVLGGLSQGLNLNIEGHLGTSGIPQRKPNNDETVIVVVEEQPNENNFGPMGPIGYNPPNHHGYNGNNANIPQRPNYNSHNEPNIPNQGGYNFPNHHRPGYNGNGPNLPPRPDFNGYRPPQNEQNRPYQNGYNVPNHQHHEPNYNDNNANVPQKPNINVYNPPQNYQNIPNQNGNVNQNAYGNSNGNDCGKTKNECVTQNQDHLSKPERNEPNYDNVHEPSTESVGGQYNDQKPDDRPHETDSIYVNKENNKTTKKPTDDEPLFVPLNPNQYSYGGDKITINAPKRETNTEPKPVQENEEDFPIDIRFQDN